MAIPFIELIVSAFIVTTVVVLTIMGVGMVASPEAVQEGRRGRKTPGELIEEGISDLLKPQSNEPEKYEPFAMFAGQFSGLREFFGKGAGEEAYASLMEERIKATEAEAKHISERPKEAATKEIETKIETVKNMLYRLTAEFEPEDVARAMNAQPNVPPELVQKIEKIYQFATGESPRAGQQVHPMMVEAYKRMHERYLAEGTSEAKVSTKKEREMEQKIDWAGKSLYRLTEKYRIEEIEQAILRGTQDPNLQKAVESISKHLTGQPTQQGQISPEMSKALDVASEKYLERGEFRAPAGYGGEGVKEEEVYKAIVGRFGKRYGIRDMTGIKHQFEEAIEQAENTPELEGLLDLKTITGLPQESYLNADGIHALLYRPAKAEGFKEVELESVKGQPGVYKFKLIK